MSATLENTGERMIPSFHKGKNIYGAHLARYQAALAFTKNKIVLDIACGSGYGSKLLSEQAKKVYGIDIDQGTVDYAEDKFSAENIEYLLGSAESIPLDDSSVEVVVSYETIEHINDQKKFLSEVKRILKPGGVLILSTPNDEEYSEGNEFHVHEFKYTELKGLIGKNFKHYKEYFQTHWIYSTILPKDMHSSEWSSKINVINTKPLKPNQCVFFLVVCSDSEITIDLEPVGVVGEHYRLVDLQARNQKMIAKQKKIDELHLQLEKEKYINGNLQLKLKVIEGSIGWRIYMFVRRAYFKVLRSFGRGA